MDPCTSELEHPRRHAKLDGNSRYHIVRFIQLHSWTSVTLPSTCLVVQLSCSIDSTDPESLSFGVEKPRLASTSAAASSTDGALALWKVLYPCNSRLISTWSKKRRTLACLNCGLCLVCIVQGTIVVLFPKVASRCGMREGTSQTHRSVIEGGTDLSFQTPGLCFHVAMTKRSSIHRLAGW